MKVKMLVTPPGGRREYNQGETFDIEESYAKKFIERGWAEPADRAAERAAKEERERIAAENKARAEQAAKDRADAEARAKAAAEANPNPTGKPAKALE